MEKVSRSDGWGDRFLYKVLIKRIKFNFSRMEKWDLQGTFLSEKFPAPSKISLRPYIPCASGNRLYNVYGNRYRIYGLKVMQRRFFGKIFEKINLNNKTYNFFRKTQWNCVLIKVLLNFFQKIVRVLGWNPKVLFQ